RHVAMLLPHSFSRSEGIRFAPDSLELWMTHRLFLLDHWSRGHGLNCRGNLEQMAALLGFELDAGFWQGLD
ncbi:MAG: chlororespiratory reduction 6 domain-containing protein, partial [Vulcanococcus sp.]